MSLLRRTFGSESWYESGTSISARALLLMAMAALRIWLAQSRLCSSCLLVASRRPPRGTRGTGSHHFSSRRCAGLLNDAEPSYSGAHIPWSTYQNSVSLKLSSVSWKQSLIFVRKTFCSSSEEMKNRQVSCSTHKEHVV